MQTYLSKSHFLYKLKMQSDVLHSVIRRLCVTKARVSQAELRKQENPLLSGLGGKPESVSRVCKEKSLDILRVQCIGSIYRTGKRDGTITNPECTLDAIFTPLTPGLH